MRNGWSEIGGSPYLASLRMDQAKNWDEFREACTYFHIPGENMVWADKYGDIGWQAVGIAPIRSTFNGLVPVNGDGNFDWDGYLPIIQKPNLFNPEIGYISTANQNVTPDTYKYWDAIGFDWADPYRGDRINKFLEDKERFNMEEMLELQVDYFSIPADEILSISDGLIKSNLEYYDKLREWDKKLTKNSIEAGIYIEWQNQLFFEINNTHIPKNVQKYINMQLFRVIEKISNMELEERSELLNRTFNSTIIKLKNKFGDNHEKWVYGQEKYKHVKIYHPLENIVNDSIRDIIALKTYPRGGDGYTPGSTSNDMNQSSGGSFRVMIDTGDWDNSFATNSPGQSGNPESKFYKNLYEDWANDIYFPLLYSKYKILLNLDQREIFKPSN